MRIYLVALGAGVLVGVIYGLLQVRSPAPPVVALIGLLGILLGEQVVPIAKRLPCGIPVTGGWLADSCGAHLPGRPPSPADAEEADAAARPGRS